MSDSGVISVVCGVLVLHQGKIFLAKSHKWGDLWIVPGGHLEYGETLETGVKREIREELSIEVSEVELVGLQEDIFSPEFHEKKHFLFIDYVARADSFDVKLNDELQEHIWITPTEALALDNLKDSVKLFIKNALIKGLL